MKSTLKTLTGFAAIIILMLAGCSNSVDSQRTNSTIGIDNPDGAGPYEDEFSSSDSLFTFDESVDYETRQTTRSIPPEGGDVTLTFDGQYRTLSFPARLVESDWDVSVTITKGKNLHGDNLEVYEFSPSGVAYYGAIDLAIESGIPNRTEMQRDITFSLYRCFADSYSLYSTANPDGRTVVDFTLNQSTKFAVVYEEADFKEPNTNLN